MEGPVVQCRGVCSPGARLLLPLSPQICKDSWETLERQDGCGLPQQSPSKGGLPLFPPPSVEVVLSHFSTVAGPHAASPELDPPSLSFLPSSFHPVRLRSSSDRGWELPCPLHKHSS